VFGHFVHSTAAQRVLGVTQRTTRFALLFILILLGAACSRQAPASTPAPEATVLPTPSSPLTLSSPLSPLRSPTQSKPAGTSTQIVEDRARALQLQVFSELWQAVRDTYIYPDYNGLDWDAVHERYRVRIHRGLDDEEFYQAMGEMIEELGDEHSAFYSPEEVADEEELLRGQMDYVGIGIYVTVPVNKDHGVLLQVFPDSPAALAGLRPHDRILALDGIPVVDESGMDNLDLLEGPAGSEIQLTVQTPGRSPRELVLVRAEIQGQLTVDARRLPGTEIGYIQIPTFQDQTITTRVRQALEDLTSAGALDGLVIDMRINGGGLASELEGTLAIFTAGKLGTFVSRDAERSLIIAADPVGRSHELPLVILIGRETESYGEVFSGVLQENGRSQLVGRTTRGNVETLWQVDLADGSRAWIASETFRPPSGADWEATGIVPDLEILLDWDEFTEENDPQLQAALNLLQNGTMN
jgi:carboxyl-terminal processing protease